MAYLYGVWMVSIDHHQGNSPLPRRRWGWNNSKGHDDDDDDVHLGDDEKDIFPFHDAAAGNAY